MHSHPARLKISQLAIIHIFAGKPRSRAQKQRLYRRLCARL
ncbi:TPA: tautomerase family protein, partial [Klebsiella variicola subsp. variicola]|nr:tautomerase family protein [Klebsiella variicola subsp. variicola]